MLGLRSACHHAQPEVARIECIGFCEAGSYKVWNILVQPGLPRRSCEGIVPSELSRNYNYNNEQHRFEGSRQVNGNKAAQPGSDRWETGYGQIAGARLYAPTFQRPEANAISRGLEMPIGTPDHTHLLLMEILCTQQSLTAHIGSIGYGAGGSLERKLSTLDENRSGEYKNQGAGDVTAGSDAGFIYQLRLWLHPWWNSKEKPVFIPEKIRGGLRSGAEALGADRELGSIEIQ